VLDLGRGILKIGDRGLPDPVGDRARPLGDIALLGVATPGADTGRLRSRGVILKVMLDTSGGSGEQQAGGGELQAGGGELQAGGGELQAGELHVGSGELQPGRGEMQVWDGEWQILVEGLHVGGGEHFESEVLNAVGGELNAGGGVHGPEVERSSSSSSSSSSSILSNHSGSGEKGRGGGDIGRCSSFKPVMGDGDIGRNVRESSNSRLELWITELRFGGISKLRILAISRSGVGDAGLGLIGSGEKLLRIGYL